MKKVDLVFSALVLITILLSCEKEKFSAKEKILTQRQWQIVEISTKSISNPSVDSSIKKNCSSDDMLIFSSNHRFDFKDNSPACDSSVFYYDNGIWTLYEEQNILFLNGTARNQQWMIKDFNDSTLKVEWRDSTSVNNNVLKTLTFKNK